MAEDCQGNGTDADTVSAHVPFSDLSLLLEKISSTQGKDKKRAVFDRFLQLWRDTHKRIHGDDKTCKDTFFPAMRLIIPHLDKERLSYGMKEVVLAKYYIDVLGLAKESGDAVKLLNYRAPGTARKNAGDFAAVAFVVLNNRCPGKGSMTVHDVNKSLDIMAQANADRNKSDIKKELQKLIRNMSALEQKWLIRMILKELKIGLSENSIFAAFHPDAKELYNVCSSLSKVCLDLRDPETSLNETEITLFTPFRPMLGQRAAIEEVEGLMEHGVFFIETKIDGERMQLHKRGNEYKYFSRGSNDYTTSFGASIFRGTLTPYIHKAFTSAVDTCILDGEMVGYNPDNESFVSKGSNIDIKSDTLDGVHPCFVVFDILLLNGEKLANVPLQDRLKKVQETFTVIPDRIQVVERKTASTRDDVVRALNDAIDRREEGIVIKHPGSVYKPSQRKGSGWLKIKPEYIDSLSDELDLLIIGGYFGSGRRGGMVSHFMLGVAVPADDPKDHPTVFHSFCKVGSGYTIKELHDLCKDLNPHWQIFDTKNAPETIILAPGYKERPDVWIDPQKSKIVQIKAAEITATDKYKTGYTLRFPRVEKVRGDKAWYDCMDLDQLHNLRSMAEGRLTYRSADVNVTGEPTTKKKRRLASRIEKPVTIAKQFIPADISNVKEVSKIFFGKEFCVINGPPNYSKQELERNIAEHGGTFTQFHTPDTYCVIASKVNLRVKNIVSQGDVDIVRASWLISCMDKGYLLRIKPEHVIHASSKTAELFSLDYDRHGDSYTEKTDVKHLREIFKNIQSDSSISAEQMAEIDLRYFPNDSHVGIFRNCRAYFDSKERKDSKKRPAPPLDMILLEYRLYGGKVLSSYSENATHVVFSERDLGRVAEMRATVRDQALKPHLVTQQWILKCIQKKYLLNEGPFEPR